MCLNAGNQYASCLGLLGSQSMCNEKGVNESVHLLQKLLRVEALAYARKTWAVVLDLTDHRFEPAYPGIPNAFSTLELFGARQEKFFEGITPKLNFYLGICFWWVLLHVASCITGILITTLTWNPSHKDCIQKVQGKWLQRPADIQRPIWIWMSSAKMFQYWLQKTC